MFGTIKWIAVAVVAVSVVVLVTYLGRHLFWPKKPVVVRRGPFLVQEISTSTTGTCRVRLRKREPWSALGVVVPADFEEQAKAVTTGVIGDRLWVDVEKERLLRRPDLHGVVIGANGEELQTRLLSEGLARATEKRSDWTQAEDAARKQRKGIWNQTKEIPE